MKHILGIPYTSVSTQFTLVGSSFFASWGQTSPYLYNKISTHYQRSLRAGFTTDGDNNGKTAHDRVRRLHAIHTGISYTDTMFLYFSINDMLYTQSSSLPDKEELTVLKVKNLHNTALACCFSKSFKYFADEAATTGTIALVADTSNTYGTKCFSGSKSMLALTNQNSSVEFTSTGITNIVYMVADGVNNNLGSFDIYVDGQLYKSIETNRQTIYYPNSYNPSVPTIGDAPISPYSIILELDNTEHNIKITNTSNTYPVWLDYHSEIETNPENGAKGAYSFTIPKLRTDRLIGATGTWVANRPHCEKINAAMKEVYDYWRDTLNAPTAIADVYNGFDPINGMNSYECTHFSQSGSDFVIQRYDEALASIYGGKKFIL